jgi:hypothetical protein
LPRSFTLGFNLDSYNVHFLVERQTGANLAKGTAARYQSVWGEPTLAWVHIVPWTALVPLTLAIVTMRGVWARCCFPKDVRYGQVLFVELGMFACIFLSTPAVINLSRAFVCESNPDFGGALRWSSNPKWACYSSDGIDHRQTILAACSVPAMLIAIIAPAVALYRSAQSLPHSATSVSHERELRACESEFEHLLRYDWRRDALWTASSFVGPTGSMVGHCVGGCARDMSTAGRGGGCLGMLCCGGDACPEARILSPPFTRLHWNLTTTALALVYAFARVSPFAQSVTVLGVMLLWSIRQSARPVYRVASSNRLWTLLLWGLTWTALLSSFKASGYRAEFTVDSFYSLAMAISQGVFGTIALVVLAHAAVAQYRRGDTHCCCSATLPDPSKRLRMWALIPSLPGTAEAWPRGTVSSPPNVNGLEDDEGRALVGTTHLEALDPTYLARMDRLRKNPTWFGTGDDLLWESPLHQASAAVVPPNGMLGGALLTPLSGPSATSQGEWVHLADHSALSPSREEGSIVGGDDGDEEASKEELASLLRSVRRRGALGPPSRAEVGTVDDLSKKQVHSVSKSKRFLEFAQLVAAKERRWVSLMRTTNKALTRARMSPELTIDVPSLRALARALSAAAGEAGTLRHVLRRPLEERAEECAALAEAAAHCSMYPWEAGEEDLEAARHRIIGRSWDLALADRRTRLILLRLLAVSAFIGHRRLKKLPVSLWAHPERRDKPNEATAVTVHGFARPKKFEEVMLEPESRVIRASTVTPDDVLALAPDRLLHVTAAACREADQGGALRRDSALGRVVAACHRRWLQHIQAAEAADKGDAVARRQRLAWYEALERTNQLMMTSGEKL